MSIRRWIGHNFSGRSIISHAACDAGFFCVDCIFSFFCVPDNTCYYLSASSATFQQERALAGIVLAIVENDL
jgi:hypothetical protein